ncbi:sensor histidine kinase [Listeria booriae]|uniref:sensor histidine kinase n=1 Tax=Listeria booriae TaxID=1552123 RepID=UPI0016268737|nr:GHKL domain-containing protein [Listeria booriae]
MSIISVSVAFIILIIASYITTMLLMLISNLDFETIKTLDFQTNVLFLLSYCALIKLVDIILSRVNKTIIFPAKYLGLVVIVSAITVGVFYFIIWQGNKAGFTDAMIDSNAAIFAIYTVIMASILLVIVRNAVRSAKVEAQALQMRQLQEYVGALEALQKDVRVFRHDYVNILSGINGFITNEDMDGLRVYFRTKVIPMNSDMEVNISKLATLHNLEVVELKGLFATKLIRAQELGVNAQVEVYKKIDQINMDSIDLCRAVGILLDNAIEAVMGTEDPTIRVAIIQKKDAIVLVFANNLPEDSPPVHQFFDEGFSTKGENRGLGLSTLKKTLKKYPNVSLDTKVTQLGFVQELEIG